MQREMYTLRWTLHCWWHFPSLLHMNWSRHSLHDPILAALCHLETPLPNTEGCGPHSSENRARKSMWASSLYTNTKSCNLLLFLQAPGFQLLCPPAYTSPISLQLPPLVASSAAIYTGLSTVSSLSLSLSLCIEIPFLDFNNKKAIWEKLIENKVQQKWWNPQAQRVPQDKDARQCGVASLAGLGVSPEPD